MVCKAVVVVLIYIFRMSDDEAISVPTSPPCPRFLLFLLSLPSPLPLLSFLLICSSSEEYSAHGTFLSYLYCKYLLRNKPQLAFKCCSGVFWGTEFLISLQSNVAVFSWVFVLVSFFVFCLRISPMPKLRRPFLCCFLEQSFIFLLMDVQMSQHCVERIPRKLAYNVALVIKKLSTYVRVSFLAPLFSSTDCILVLMLVFTVWVILGLDV